MREVITSILTDKGMRDETTIEGTLVSKVIPAIPWST
jgi:hypothetical protein